MQYLNKVISTGLLVVTLTTSVQAFVPVVITGEILGEVVSSSVLATSSVEGVATRLIVNKGTKKVMMKILKGDSNYRKTALIKTQKKQGGWIQDPYNKKYYRAKDMDVDHIWPKSKGGTNHSWNLIMASKHTNRSKGNKIDSRVLIGYYENAKQGLQNLIK
jgi:hypothetical protein